MRRAATVGAVLGVSAAIAVMWSCSVQTRSGGLKCGPNNTCSAGRTCQGGYCVVTPTFQDARIDVPPPPPDAPPDAAVCPTVCPGTACNFATHQCNVTGSGGASITCPVGWHCTITCASAGACGSITCSAGCDVTCSGGSASCGNITTGSGSSTVTCNGSNACGNITSGTGALAATCANGIAACGNVSCASSCQCDVTCNPITDCGTNTCPTAAGSACTTTGVAGSPCDSAIKRQCQKC